MRTPTKLEETVKTLVDESSVTDVVEALMRLCRERAEDELIERGKETLNVRRWNRDAELLETAFRSVVN